MPEFIAEGKERLDRFLARMQPEQSRTRLVKWIEDGGVQVDGEAVLVGRFELKPGMVVAMADVPPTPPQDLNPVPMDLDIRYEDEHLLVVNKPRGLAVHPSQVNMGATLVHGLLARSHSLSQEGGSFRPGIVHRLDKETTGLLVVAKTDAAHRHLAAQIKSKTAERRYVAQIFGDPAQPRFTIDAPVGRHPGIPSLMTIKPTGRAAVTHVTVLTRVERGTLVACRLTTGRTHQIRIHLSHFGFAVRGDVLYAKDKWKEGPMQLHAAYLAFAHPVTRAEIAVFCEPPIDFELRDLVLESALRDWEAGP